MLTFILLLGGFTRLLYKVLYIVLPKNTIKNPYISINLAIQFRYLSYNKYFNKSFIEKIGKKEVACITVLVFWDAQCD